MDSSTAGLLAQAGPAGQQGTGSFLVTMLPFALIFVIFYFLLILPARRRQKKHQEMLDNLKAGDRVITNGGLYGTVVALDGAKVVLRVADQVKMEFARAAVAGLQDSPEK
jgi:preprotein translocase subunit YajC